MGATKRTLRMRVGFILAATALALPAAAGTAAAAPGVPGTPGVPGASEICDQLAGQLSSLLNQAASLRDQINATPLGPLLTSLTAQLTQVQSQINSTYSQLSGQFCSTLGGGGTGGGSVGSGSIANTPDDYGYDYPRHYGSGHRNYGYDDYDADAPVVATQVDAVPRGGVATGDGSFGE
jgi:hypothetical protein